MRSYPYLRPAGLVSQGEVAKVKKISPATLFDNSRLATGYTIEENIT